MDGPYISASINPTLAPCLARATAKLLATVDLPTPPLPDAMAIIFLTPARASLFCLAWVTLEDMVTLTTASLST